MAISSLILFIIFLNFLGVYVYLGFPCDLKSKKKKSAMQEIWVPWSLDLEDPLE